MKHDFTLFVFAGALLTRPAWGQLYELPEKTEENRWGQRNFGLAATALLYSGFGGGFQVGGHPFLLSATGTYYPILLFFPGAVELVSSAQVNVDPVVWLNGSDKRFWAGLSPNYRYNTVMGHGFGASFFGMLNVSQVAAMQLQAGLAYFPKGEEGIGTKLARCDVPGGCSYIIDPGLIIAANIGFAYFP